MSWLRPIVAVSALAATGACVEPTTDEPVNVPDSQTADGVLDENTAHALFITGEGGGDIAARADGLLPVEIRVGRFDDIQSLGFEAVVDGAKVVEWTRDDALLTAAGGQIVPLEQKVENGRMRMVLGTTRAIRTDSPEGDVIARLVLQPTAASVHIALRAEGSDLGVVTSGGARIDVQAFSATFNVEGN